MTLDQKKVIRELLRLSVDQGFGCGYPLAPIAEKLGIKDPLYDNETNTGVLWDFGPYGKGFVDAHGDWPTATASISYDFAHMLENWVHPNSKPIG